MTVLWKVTYPYSNPVQFKPDAGNMALLLQTNLTWLDLSFNNISKIEGLETLTQLRDLSLFNNNICVIENLDTLTDLQVLSLGELTDVPPSKTNKVSLLM